MVSTPVTQLNHIFPNHKLDQAVFAQQTPLANILTTTAPLISTANALADNMRDLHAFGENKLIHASFDVQVTSLQEKNNPFLQLVIKPHHEDSDNQVQALSLQVDVSNKRVQQRFMSKCQTEFSLLGEQISNSNKNVQGIVNARGLNKIMRMAGKYQVETNRNKHLQKRLSEIETEVVSHNAEHIKNKGTLSLAHAENAMTSKIMRAGIEQGEAAKHKSLTSRATYWGLSKNKKMRQTREGLQSAEEYAQLVQQEIGMALKAIGKVKTNHTPIAKQAVTTLIADTTDAAHKLKVNLTIGTTCQALGTFATGVGMALVGSAQYDNNPFVGGATIAAGAGLCLNAVGQAYSALSIRAAKHSIRDGFQAFHESTKGSMSELANAVSICQKSITDAVYGFNGYRDSIDNPSVEPLSRSYSIPGSFSDPTTL
ncbi:MAG: hypothetical protein VX185_14945 [Pseudomonadota bacterium]|nr:hypothetical protein [Gammaproteobacteria bacterium]MEC8012048.1 hypothetical protein [Pseudomonadota bacterium]HBF08734.1 hypothetical protein [Gammaproteobacteria bacterium]|tara:strand:- start:2167 stop:3447 length:1281 start_codon:yes stop_codon:yes gene_type:complete